MDYQSIYTSTGVKLVQHPDLVKKLKYGYAQPVSLQIAPTSRCNLNCSFCSNVNREHHEDIEIDKVIKLIGGLRNIGLKTVEVSGGGDPTMYPGINILLRYCHDSDLKTGMITNGLLLNKNITQENLDNLSWLRISMNGLDYQKMVDVPTIKGTLGFSYVLNDKTTDAVLESLHYHVRNYGPEYVRIVPNCQVSHEEQTENNLKYSEMVSGWGEPYFYQAKVFYKPSACYWCYVKPFLLHDGWVYPCSSVVLNDDADRKFHSKYRWTHMHNLLDMYKQPMESFNNESCEHCVFAPQNIAVENIINSSNNKHNDFI